VYFVTVPLSYFGSPRKFWIRSCSPIVNSRSLSPLSILDFWSLRLSKTCPPRSGHIKVTEHSFQVPMLNSPLLLNYSWFGARFLRESWLTKEEFIRAFWLRCVLLPWQSSHESSLQDKSLCFSHQGNSKKEHFKSPRVYPKALPRGFCRRRAVECALQKYFLLFIAILDLLFLISRNSTLDYICKDLHHILATECAFYGFTCSVYRHNET